MAIVIRNLAFWLSCPMFIPLKVHIPEYGIQILGYFPYHRAKLNPTELYIGRHITPLPLPRELFRHIENVLEQYHINDNKSVYICESNNSPYDNKPFALMYKDTYCMIGEWDSVVRYDGKPINQKT